MFTTDALTRKAAPSDVQELRNDRRRGRFGDGDSWGGTLAATLVVAFFSVLFWLGAWIFPFQGHLGPFALAVALIAGFLVALVAVGVLWQSIPELLRRPGSQRSWHRVAAFAQDNGLTYISDADSVPPSVLMASDYHSSEAVVRGTSGPFGEAGQHKWSCGGEDREAFGSCHYLYLRLPDPQPFAFIARTKAERDYGEPLRHAMQGHPPATLSLPLQRRYYAVADPGYDPGTFDILTTGLLGTIEKLGGNADVEISGTNLWIYSEQEYDIHDPRFWHAVDVIIANVLGRLPGGPATAQLPLPATANDARVSLTPRRAATLEGQISCWGIIAVAALIQAAACAVHLLTGWPRVG